MTCLYCGGPITSRGATIYCGRRCFHAHRSERAQRRMRTFFKKHYAMKGGAWCAAKLGVTERTAQSYAHMLGVSAYYRDGYMTINEITQATGDGNAVIRKAAADVLERGATRTYVPLKWAEAYIAQRRALAENEKARLAGYLTTDQAARYLRMDSRRFLALGLPYIEGKRRSRLYNPHDIEAIYRQLRRRAA